MSAHYKTHCLGKLDVRKNVSFFDFLGAFSETHIFI